MDEAYGWRKACLLASESLAIAFIHDQINQWKQDLTAAYIIAPEQDLTAARVIMIVGTYWEMT